MFVLRSILVDFGQNFSQRALLDLNKINHDFDHEFNHDFKRSGTPLFTAVLAGEPGSAGFPLNLQVDKRRLDATAVN